MSTVISDSLVEALEAANIIRSGDRVRRVVIDLQVGHVPVIHVERYGDEKVIHLFRALEGVEVSLVDAGEKAEQ